MLTYSFDLLYFIYEEEGYDSPDIPNLILEKNLYGIEIDGRAGELAAFALVMKAREKYKRFFAKPIQPRICVLENVVFKDNELKTYMEEIGRDLFTINFQETLHQFREADNFGSLIQPALTDVTYIRRVLKEKDVGGNIFLHNTHEKVLKVLNQTDFLSPKYHVVVANPPYMGGKGMNGKLAAWLKDNYTEVKSDLFSAFIFRNTKLALPKGQLGFMSPFVWMFISSYEKLRSFLINQKTITSLVQLEYSGFEGATVPICTFTIENAHHLDLKGGYVRLSDFRGSENQGPKTLEAIKNPGCGWFYRASAAEFKKIPGSPIAYWLSASITRVFDRFQSVGEVSAVRKGLVTLDDSRFIKYWHEVSFLNIQFGTSNREESKISKCKWFPINKGGGYRKWFGLNENVINWANDGQELKEFIVKKYNGGSYTKEIRSEEHYFKENITWGSITSGPASFRYTPNGFLFSSGGSCIFPDVRLNSLLQPLNSKVTAILLKALTPTLNYVAGDISRLPISDVWDTDNTLANDLIDKSKKDWDSFETSWHFTTLPLIHSDYLQLSIETNYTHLRSLWMEKTLEVQRLEEENNHIFLEAYGLQDELKPEVPLNEITLTCNPHYRYGGKKSNEELEGMLLADTMREIISYAVGCMFGRYSLDKPGLILANQGETIERLFAADSRAHIPCR